MDPNNPPMSPQGPQTPPKDPNLDGAAQPLNTPTQTPTEMPMGEPITPLPPPPNGGLPKELPNNLEASKPPGNSGMLMVISIILVILIILGIAGYYFYSNMNKPLSGKAPEVPQAVQNNQDTGELRGLETELSRIDLTDPEGELGEVDQEIVLLEATPSAR